MRGEDSSSSAHTAQLTGSPPHARGRRQGIYSPSPFARITPACAGKTDWRSAKRASAQDHPRMRGEDGGILMLHHMVLGSPPHARGRQKKVTAKVRRNRITPACAGKTATGTVRIPTVADHPRMRGEDAARLSAKRLRTGSPPHARGRLKLTIAPAPCTWITPACAGKTPGWGRRLAAT